MDWYAITDSDWNWDTDDGGAPFIAYAETPEEAIQQALEAWKKPDGGWDFDGVQVKVAIMKTIGFQSIDIRNGAAVKEPFLKIPVPDEAAIRAELVAALEDARFRLFGTGPAAQPLGYKIDAALAKATS